jgi:hypothetical protein
MRRQVGGHSALRWSDNDGTARAQAVRKQLRPSGAAVTYDAAVESDHQRHIIACALPELRPISVADLRRVRCWARVRQRRPLVFQRVKKGMSRKPALRLPDLDHAKFSVPNSTSPPRSRRNYKFAIERFIPWYCSKPRLALNRTVVLRCHVSINAFAFTYRVHRTGASRITTPLHLMPNRYGFLAQALRTSKHQFLKCYSKTTTSWSRTDFTSNWIQPPCWRTGVTLSAETVRESRFHVTSSGIFNLTVNGPTGISSSTGVRQVPALVRFTRCRTRRSCWR